MILYTFVMDFEGGTYISQIKNTTLKKAVISWAKNLNCLNISYFGDKSKNQILKYLLEEEYSPVQVDGLKNVWCTSFLLFKGSAIVHIIKTDPN